MGLPAASRTVTVTVAEPPSVLAVPDEATMLDCAALTAPAEMVRVELSTFVSPLAEAVSR